MKKILLILLFGFGLVLQAQTIQSLPYNSEIKQLPDGWHKFILEGATFDVEIISGRLVQGNVKWFDGASYSGSFGGDDIAGRGTYTWPNGLRYEGSFKNNQRHGKGSLIQKDGSKWSGKWKYDQKNGKGKVFSASGSCVKKLYCKSTFGNSIFVLRRFSTLKLSYL